MQLYRTYLCRTTCSSIYKLPQQENCGIATPPLHAPPSSSGTRDTLIACVTSACKACCCQGLGQVLPSVHTIPRWNFDVVIRIIAFACHGLRLCGFLKALDYQAAYGLRPQTTRSGSRIVSTSDKRNRPNMRDESGKTKPYFRHYPAPMMTIPILWRETCTSVNTS